MSLQKRVEDIEKVLPQGGAEKCQRIIYKIVTTKEDVDSAGPSDAQVQAFLVATGRCLKCVSRICFLTWNVAKGEFAGGV